LFQKNVCKNVSLTLGKGCDFQVAENSNPRKSECGEQEVSVKWRKLDNLKLPSNKKMQQLKYQNQQQHHQQQQQQQQQQQP
jgi:hypothetical protein